MKAVGRWLWTVSYELLSISSGLPRTSLSNPKIPLKDKFAKFAEGGSRIGVEARQTNGWVKGIGSWELELGSKQSGGGR